MLEEEFLEAVSKSDAGKVVRLLGQTSSANALPTKNGRNALHIACQLGSSDVVNVLLISGLYSVDEPDFTGYTALQIAAAEGHLEVVKLLLKAGARVNCADQVHGNTALHEASWKGYSKTVAELAKSKDCDLNVKNWGGFTPLHLCCQKGHNQSCRELLLVGCDPDLQNNYGDTPLHTSARYGHAGVMRILISAKCRVSDYNKNGDTALHIAAAMGHRKLTRILLEAGCNKAVLNKQNETAEDIAIRKCLVEIIDTLRNTTATATAQPANPNKSTTSGEHSQKLTVKSKSCEEKGKKKEENGDLSDLVKTKTAIPWSPYGCHYYPDATDFPEPNLDTLPSEPLKKGEQYYLDLAGNIKKGPVGVGYTCYCAPFFKELESHLDKKAKRLKRRINKAEERINERLANVERKLNINNNNKVKGRTSLPPECCNKSVVGADTVVSPSPVNEDEMMVTTRAFGECVHISQKGDGGIGTEKRRHDDGRFNFRSSEHLPVCTELNNQNYQSAYYPVSHSHHNNENKSAVIEEDHIIVPSTMQQKQPQLKRVNVWSKTELEKSETEMLHYTDDDEDGCELATDHHNGEDMACCGDSGYSTKMCSNSQGPSPSLSGRLETDGLLSVNVTSEEKKIVSSGSSNKVFHDHQLRNIPIQPASIV